MISGPNTGGKTVALKTLGLAAVLHQCGLRPPAEEAALPVFDQVLGDIGDEQSIAMSLSTFSGHVRNLVAILEAATDRSLVLLDEVAGGTDPVEGAALARALLGRLTRQARLTVATSHYPELKEWASATEGVTNAATGFDPETEEPLYRITLGRPGTSHALRIAERLGLAPDLVAEARRNVAPERLRVAELLAEAEAAEEQAAEDRESAASARAAAESSRDAAEARVAELEAGDRAGSRVRARRARACAGRGGERARRDAGRSSTRFEPRSARPAGWSASATARRHRGRSRRSASETGRLGAASDRAAQVGRALREAEEPAAAHGPARAGRPGRRPGRSGCGGRSPRSRRRTRSSWAGEGFGCACRSQRLRPDRDAPADDPEDQAVTIRTPTPTDAPSELDLRGRTAQEAREALRAFVDTAALAGRDEVRVIHGRGTGAIRKAVRDELSRHPLVSSHESDSADGATVVRLGA